MTTAKAEIPDQEDMDKAVAGLIEQDQDNKKTNDRSISNSRTGEHIDIGKALTLRLRNDLSYGAIAKQLNCAKSSIYARLKPFEKMLSDPAADQTYDDNRNLLLNAVERQLVTDMLDEDKRKSASLNNTAYAAKTVFEMRRLDKGESTANISHHVLSEKISELDSEEARLRAELEGN